MSKRPIICQAQIVMADHITGYDWQETPLTCELPKGHYGPHFASGTEADTDFDVQPGQRYKARGWVLTWTEEDTNRVRTED